MSDKNLIVNVSLELVVRVADENEMTGVGPIALQGAVNALASKMDITGLGYEFSFTKKVRKRGLSIRRGLETA